MDANSLRLILVAAALAFSAWFGWWMRGDLAPRPEVTAAAPAVRQEDGSLVAAREPHAKPPPAPHALPMGSREERRISATVSPAKPDCPPVRLDLSLVRDDAGGRRMVASSPDGEVIQALDMPIEAAFLPPPARPWAAGVSWAPREELGGVWIERDLGRLRVGADIEEAGGGELQARVRVGWRF
ncbi:hypothetical protein [Solimonas fluminis]|uniref:hypothetical protein n=1 Tax=Solimonas fluminis TaxID=2086571 RepID=UPI000CE78F3A|nr:hypothetical protein [Solimonas fluminis]